MMTWGSALDPDLCKDLCSVGQQIPRTAFDLTGVYVDPATAAAVTGLLYLLNSGQEAKLYAPGQGQLWKFDQASINTGVFLYIQRNAKWCCINIWKLGTNTCQTKQMAGFIHLDKNLDLNLNMIGKNLMPFNPIPNTIDDTEKKRICSTYYAIPDNADNAYVFHAEEKLFDNMERVLLENPTTPTVLFLWTLNSPCSGEFTLNDQKFSQRTTRAGKKVKGKLKKVDRGSCLQDIIKFTADNIYSLPISKPLHTLNVGFKQWYISKDMEFNIKAMNQQRAVFSRNTFCNKVNEEKVKAKYKFIDSDGLTFSKIFEEANDSNWDPGNDGGNPPRPNC